MTLGFAGWMALTSIMRTSYGPDFTTRTSRNPIKTGHRESVHTSAKATSRWTGATVANPSSARREETPAHHLPPIDSKFPFHGLLILWCGSNDIFSPAHIIFLACFVLVG